MALGIHRLTDTAVRKATPKHDRETLTEQLVWFTKNLPIPKRFNRYISCGRIAWATLFTPMTRRLSQNHSPTPAQTHSPPRTGTM